MLLSDEDITNIKDLKEISEKIITQFQVLRDPAKEENSLIDFISQVSNQQEILSSELWKLNKFVEYVFEIAKESEKPNLCSSMRSNFDEF